MMLSKHRFLFKFMVMANLFMLQKQNVERAKLLLLSSNLDNKSALDESFRQSDHLLMIIAYDKWAKILHQVKLLSFYIPNIFQSHLPVLLSLLVVNGNRFIILTGLKAYRLY